ncbi:MAG: hypothetical protein ABH871_01440 [Pseudomonadota bacterium]
MPSWEEVQIHAKKMIEEGMRILRSGMSEASFLAESTAEAAKLHVSLRHNRLDRYKALHELGRMVCDKAEAGAAASQLTLTEEMKKKIKQVSGLDDEAQKFEAEIAKLTIIRKETEKKTTAAHAKKTSAATKKT